MAPEIPDVYWQGIQQQLGYTDEELQLFKDNPKNARVLAGVPELANTTFVFEVVESTHCNSQHVKGTRFYYSGDGNLLTKMAPSKVCAYILPVMTQSIFAMQELVYAGIPAAELTFRRAGCFDVGVHCGGWGRVIVEATTLPRTEAQALFGK